MYKCDECNDTGYVGDQNAGMGGRNTEWSYCDNCEIGKQKQGQAIQVEAKVKVNFADRVRLTNEQLNDVSNMVEQWNDEKSKDRAIEELLELGLSLCHLMRGKTNLENLHKEMADVRLALEHLEFKFGDYQKELNEKLAHNSKISA
jgi:hypothetical protein